MASKDVEVELDQEDLDNLLEEMDTSERIELAKQIIKDELEGAYAQDMISEHISELDDEYLVELVHEMAEGMTDAEVCRACFEHFLNRHQALVKMEELAKAKNIEQVVV